MAKGTTKTRGWRRGLDHLTSSPKDIQIFFTADTHFNHPSILKYCKRPFSSIEEMNETIIENWNARVREHDTIYIVGDFAFGRPQDAAVILDRLNGQKFLIQGNHDSVARHRLCKNKFVWIKSYHTIAPRLGESKQPIILFHYAQRVWDRMHHGSWQLHGHCVDLDTEILTVEGWKNRNSITIEDQVISYDHSTKRLVVTGIEEVIDVPCYKGLVYALQAKGLDFRVTKGHTIPHFSRGNNSKYLREESVESFSERNNAALRRSGVLLRRGVDLSQNLLKLYILIAADGCIARPETKLIRFGLKKDRKIRYLHKVLNALEISFNEHPDLLAGGTRTSFHLPPALWDLRLKGLDNTLLGCSREQFKSILEAYEHSDGRKEPGGTSWTIYSSKEEEIDLLQALAVQCGFSASKTTRPPGRGYSIRDAYELTVSDREVVRYSNIKNRVKVEEVLEEHFWCIRCPQQNFFMRRNGKVHLTGNSHGTLWNQGDLTLDVGVDCWDFTPVHLHEIYLEMRGRTFTPVDHHDEGVN